MQSFFSIYSFKIYLNFSSLLFNERKHRKTISKTFSNTSKVISDRSSLFDESVKQFELQCQSLSHFLCQCCHMVSVNIKPSNKNSSVCTTCQASYASKESMTKDLPIWYDKKKVVKYHLPDELKCL